MKLHGPVVGGPDGNTILQLGKRDKARMPKPANLVVKRAFGPFGARPKIGWREHTPGEIQGGS
jgi:hypothetical protein